MSEWIVVWPLSDSSPGAFGTAKYFEPFADEATAKRVAEALTTREPGKGVASIHRFDPLPDWVRDAPDPDAPA